MSDKIANFLKHFSEKIPPHFFLLLTSLILSSWKSHGKQYKLSWKSERKKDKLLWGSHGISKIIISPLMTVHDNVNDPIL